MTRKTLVALLGVLFVFGCGEDGPKKDSSPRQAATSKVAKKAVAAPSKAPAEKDVQKEFVYTYNPSGKRNPFESLLDIQRPVAPEQTEPLTPLQKYDLQQLRLLGAVVGLEEPKAMVIAPDGKSYILRVGTKVGKHNGTVVDINSEGVFVEEVYYNFAGEVKKNIKTINLPKREGVK